MTILVSCGLTAVRPAPAYARRTQQPKAKPPLLSPLSTGFLLAVEEEELTERFPAAYPLYQQRTPWRYLPGLR